MVIAEYVLHEITPEGKLGKPIEEVKKEGVVRVRLPLTLHGYSHRRLIYEAVPRDNPKPNPPDGLPCQTIVYRAALDPTWFSSDNQIDASAFYCRRGEDGISIVATPEACRSYMENPMDGIISVHVGHVQDVRDPGLAAPLDVIFDERPHGIIVNVRPKEKKGPRRRLADRIASLLARRASL